MDNKDKEKNDEDIVWESADPDVDINELNKCDITNRTPATVGFFVFRLLQI